jgi:ATP-dependent exoDNAse (exonuclease V) alpha subunit
MLSSKIDLNPDFQQAIDLMEHGRQSLFITGKAGTGKSTLLSYFCANTTKEPVVLAPTGVAALNVKGQTIHKFFGFSIDVTREKIEAGEFKPKSAKLYKKLALIVIDEVSMLRADLLDCIDMFLRLYGPEAKQPFGGVKMIFIGDLYQLPPVVSPAEREMFSTTYQTPYFFSAHALKHLDLELIELEKVYRQKDPAFVELLNRIRNNSVEDDDIVQLNQRFQPNYTAPEKVFTIHLTTTNQRADEINDAHLDGLTGKMHHASAGVKGDFGKEYYPTATDLRFKAGSQIMMVSNDQSRRWVNGSIGVIESLQKDEDGYPCLSVRLQGQDEAVTVYPFTWEIYRFAVEGGKIVSEPMGSFTQFPFRLAWAVTIHKSQGKTFDHVVIDLGRGTFVAGQLYVALSRCTSFEGIVLKTPIRKQHIRTDFRIYKFLTGYHYRKSEAALSLQDKVKLIGQAIAEGKNLGLTYLKANDTKSERVVTPLTVGKETYKGAEYLGVKAYCTKRHEERMFRVDRILTMQLLS